MRKLWFVLAAVAVYALPLFLTGGTNLRRYTTQEALNRVIGARPHEYTTQEALNIIQGAPAVRDSLVTLFSWSWDDGLDTLWTYVDSFQVHNQPFNVSIIAAKPLHGDTIPGSAMGSAGTFLSVSDLRAMEKRTITDENGDTQPLVRWNGHGWGGADYNAGGTFIVKAHDMWRADTPAGPNRKMYRGKFANYAFYDMDPEMCYKAIVDTMGLIPPRGWVIPNSASFRHYNREIEKWFDFSLVLTFTSTGHENGRHNYEMFTGYGLLEGAFPRVSATPYWSPDPYDIYHPLVETSSFTTFRSFVLEAVAVKGSWINFVGHNPGTMLTETGHNITDHLSFLDSLTALGVLRVVRPDDAYEIMFDMDVGRHANFLHPNMADMNGDGQMDWLSTINDHASFYPDSFYVYDAQTDGTGDGNQLSASDNHGVFGEGYFTLDWPAGYIETDINGHDDSQTGSEWYRARDFQLRIPNIAKGGKEIVVEFWCQIDPGVMATAGVSVGTNETPLGTADSVGVTFEAWMNRNRGVRGVTASVRSNSTATYSTDYWWKIATVDDYKTPPNSQTFSSTDTIGGNWNHVMGRWTPPDWAEFVYINIIKDSRLASGAVRISGLSVSVNPVHGDNTRRRTVFP